MQRKRFSLHLHDADNDDLFFLVPVGPGEDEYNLETPEGRKQLTELLVQRIHEREDSMTDSRYPTADDAVRHILDEIESSPIAQHQGKDWVQLYVVQSLFADLLEQLDKLRRPITRTPILGGHAARHTDLVRAQPETPDDNPR